jgi:hypothetical protein
MVGNDLSSTFCFPVFVFIDSSKFSGNEVFIIPLAKSLVPIDFQRIKEALSGR